MKKLTIIALAFILGTGLFLFSNKKAEAYRGDINIKGPNYSEERHTQMQKAFETNDYNLWKSLVKDNNGRVNQVINESNFAKFATMHKLMLEGKKEEAQKIRQELGLGLKNGTGARRGMGKNCVNN